MDFSLFEFVDHSTTKIVTTQANGAIGMGTGFFFQYNLDNDATATVLVTNKHVVRGAMDGTIRITALNADETPNFSDITDVNLTNFEGRWIMHPSNDIDLCVMPVAAIFNKIGDINKRACFAPLREHNLPDYNEIDIYKPTEEIYMAGYPDGLADDLHNLPLIRRGITATPFYISHNGADEFVVDCACFRGSSGSPVMIVNESSYALHKQPLRAGNRLKLLGILYAGPLYDAQGNVFKKNVPTQDTVVANIPMNLGYCVPSIKLMDFKPILQGMINP